MARRASNVARLRDQGQAGESHGVPGHELSGELREVSTCRRLRPAKDPGSRNISTRSGFASIPGGAAQPGILPFPCCHERMTPTPSDGLAILITGLAVAAIAAQALADVAWEVRILLLSWLALRGTQPRQRAQILAALRTGRQRPRRTGGRARSAQGPGTARHAGKPGPAKPSPVHRACRERHSA